jgi:NitT/TauT family transport system substrate-binding protein
MRRLFALGMALALLAVGQSAVGDRAGGAAPVAQAAPGPQALQTVRAGMISNATDATFFWAQDRGYLREQGLEIEMTPFNSAQFMVAPLGADQLDVGGGAPGPGLFNAILRGVSLRIVADRARAVPGTRFNCFMVRSGLLDSGAVRSFADLRGRVVAENAPAVITTYALERHLQQAGLGLQDVNMPTMSFPDMLTGFANDVVDAAFEVEPFITIGEQRGVARCWQPTSDLEPNFQIAVLLYGPGFAEQRTESARRFALAYLRATRDYYRAFFGDGQGRGEMLQLVSNITGMRDMALLERIAPSWMDPNGSVNLESLRAVEQWYRTRGEVTGQLDLDRVVDMSFVNYGIQQLGPYPAP